MDIRNRPVMIGIDVGSTTVKATVVDPETNEILWSDYQRHQTKQPEKVLELIAFVQSVLGRKIPDTQIVLSNFRSIATIARVFAGEAPVATNRRVRRNPRLQPTAGSPVAELLARGEMELTPDGRLILRGTAASLRD